MRQVVSGLLVLVTLAIGAPLVGADPSTATLIGQLVDAGGRGAVGRSVELVRDGAVVTTTVTSASGEFTFGGIAPGSYVVRTMVNNQPAGTRIAVNAGESIPVTVVLPSLATASPQVASLASFFASLGMTSTMAITNQLFTAGQSNADFAYVQNVDILAIQALFNRWNLDAFNFESFGRFFNVGPYGTS